MSSIARLTSRIPPGIVLSAWLLATGPFPAHAQYVREARNDNNAAVKVTIQINDTPATNDDLVMLKDAVCGKRWVTPCQAKVENNPPNDVTVILTSPDGRLRFPNKADSTLTLTLPRGGAWVPFQISGEVGSLALGDAEIQAVDAAAGAIVGEAGATVFSLQQASFGVSVGSSYSLVDVTGKPGWDAYSAFPNPAPQQAQAEPGGELYVCSVSGPPFAADSGVTTGSRSPTAVTLTCPGG
jgi:hypothetical protein